MSVEDVFPFKWLLKQRYTSVSVLLYGPLWERSSCKNVGWWKSTGRNKLCSSSRAKQSSWSERRSWYSVAEDFLPSFLQWLQAAERLSGSRQVWIATTAHSWQARKLFTSALCSASESQHARTVTDITHQKHNNATKSWSWLVPYLQWFQPNGAVESYREFKRIQQFVTFQRQTAMYRWDSVW